MHAENGQVVAAPAFFKKKKFMHTKGLNREFALPKTIRILIFFLVWKASTTTCASRRRRLRRRGCRREDKSSPLDLDLCMNGVP